jgi:hypothetical protein
LATESSVLGKELATESTSPVARQGPNPVLLKVAQEVINLVLIVLEAIIVLLFVHVLHDDELEQLCHSDEGHKGQAIHPFDKIFKLAVVVNEDSEPLLLDVSPDGLFLM